MMGQGMLENTAVENSFKIINKMGFHTILGSVLLVRAINLYIQKD